MVIKVVTRLNKMQSFNLMKLVQESYTASNLADAAFAALATERLGFTVNDSHIKGSRYALKIESNVTMGGAVRQRHAQYEDRISQLESQVVELDAKIKQLQTLAKTIAPHAR